MKKFLLLILFIPYLVVSQSIDSHDYLLNNSRGRYETSENDIVINEIMFDPSPRVNLPDAEYVEIYNNSQDDIQLENWKLIVGKKSYSLSSKILASGQYLILTKDVSLFPGVNTLEVNITSLTNSGTVLKIESELGKTINQVSYSTDLFSDESKKDGGWSLELINPNNYCLGVNNWIGSKSGFGGTPGFENSVTDFEYFPSTKNFIFKVTASDDVDIVSVFFNGFIDTTSFVVNTDYNLDYSIYSINESNGSAIVTFNFDKPLVDRVNYFVFDNLKSCDGSYFSTDTIWISNFGNLENGDIIINEVMFNPKDESSEFIEIFNKSDKFLSLRNVYVSNYANNDDVSVKVDEKRISEENIIFPPQSYFVITKNAKSVIDVYNSNSYKNFVEISSMPKLNNDDGNVAVLDAAYNFVDKMVYTSEMHLGLISSENQKGISLERIKSSSPSLDFNNWTSASQGSGGATPGFVNSVSLSDFLIEDIFEVYPEVFSPNNDGSFDVVELKYNLNEVGVVANVKIFNSNGIFIKEIANNELLGSSGSFIWNGMDKYNSLCKKGIYIFWVELFDTNGNVKVYKRICVLG